MALVTMPDVGAPFVRMLASKRARIAVRSMMSQVSHVLVGHQARMIKEAAVVLVKTSPPKPSPSSFSPSVAVSPRSSACSQSLERDERQIFH